MKKLRVPFLRGLTVQLLAITVLPLTLLLLLIAFGSVALHQQDMRALVGERDERAVQSAAAALESELHHRMATISSMATYPDGSGDLAFEQILAAGLRLGQTIRILDRNPQRYLLTDGETEYRLAPAVAANVSVAALPESEVAKASAIPLAELTYDQRAEIVVLDEAVQGFTRRRFLDLGLTPGTVIYPELQNFFGDPRAYRIRGTLIALRKDQAAQIWVKPR